MNKLVRVSFVFMLMLLIIIDVDAQCSMCKAVVESSSETGGISKKGINNGIMYLMGVPYLLIMTAGYFIYRNYKKSNSVQELN